MLRVIFRDGSHQDIDANAAAPFGRSGVMLSRLDVSSGLDPSTMQRIERVTNPQLGHVAPQLVRVFADFVEVVNLDATDQFAEGAREPAFAGGSDRP